ncbi:CRISPR-associated helicase Cas3' [Kitasatospora paracochleata]|uniref:CRISPR-associated endonuclease/helicase Cas3 n=1 Tax=Kitasatospora paracochleata TaxID=58354 RepID=A0ABT1J9A9_9ACTN|nr:CRISPR-associated helicase Cas3' [Kitasatospora paracochleata]MCP2314032.1 CRISPR-associated endonuclease/helicase Cas3 [Kitasatospora paracochleata]
MADSAAVAGLLWDEWLPARVRGLVGGVLPGGQADGRRLAVWLAAVHDVGKVTPAFACQVDGLADGMRAVGLEMPYRRELGPDRRMAPHGLAGQLLLQEWLERRCGWPGRVTAQFAVVVGGHHGVPPDHPAVADLVERPELLRTPGRSEGLWLRVQEEFLDACAAEFGVEGRLGGWGAVKLPQTVQVVLSGLVIMADWIASNPDLFPYFPQELGQGGARRVAAAWKGLGLPGPWRPELPGSGIADVFAARFELPPGAVVRPVQMQAFEAARAMPEPGLLVVEAPMGEGKTEAALAAVEVLAARVGAGGVFFALPTMATSNAMFARVLDWLERLPARDGERLSVLLAHSKAALNRDAAALRAASWQRISAVDPDVDVSDRVPAAGAESPLPAELVAHQWLAGRKKGMLSSFVVGTIDQLLFAGLKGRHLVLRHLAMAGKVVVIDEAHAFDTYMNSYLDRVLGWLGAYGVPVVVLSATLPAARRRALAEAYAGAEPGDGRFAEVAGADAYPLVTAVGRGQEPQVGRPGASGRGGWVRLERLDDDLDALGKRLESDLGGGGCALVVRNTVDRVLEAAAALRERFGSDAVTVAHARFIDVDRAENDRRLLELFGRDGARRPGRHIVVASQVAEQSLDVDFDLLVTDAAPVDLLLQRVGRLHRHERSWRPESLRAATCLVTGVDWSGPVPVVARGSEAVYGRHTLLRSLAVLLPCLDGERLLELPGDISALVQRAYGDEPVGPPAWAQDLAEARLLHDRLQAQKARAADVFRLREAGRAGRSLMGWVAGGAGDADDTRAGRAQVRDSPESVEVIVVEVLADGSLATVGWAGEGRGGLPLPTGSVPDPRASKAAAACGLRLPARFARPYVIDRVIAELEQFCFENWQVKENPWLAGQLILPIRPGCPTPLAGFELTYTRENGLEVSRAE